MQYGYFDDINKEYVITSPNTPLSWSNYLGSTQYGAIITNNAGGYSFYKSAAQGRFTRLRFNSIPMDQPGRYFYIHDKDSKDYWSGSWQPVGKPLDQFKSECRHGSAYTKIKSDYAGIQTNVTYFVPLGKDYECWWLKIKNESSVKRNLRLFTYVEYACNWNAGDDLTNLQYTQYISTMKYMDGLIDHGSNVHLPEMPDNFEEKDQGRHTFLTLVGAEISGFDTNREVFIGPYRTYENPETVERGQCAGSLSNGGNPCGVLQFDIMLNPGEEKEIAVLMGIGRADTVGKQIKKEYKDITAIEIEFEKLKSFWHNRMMGLTVETPDAAVNSMMNMWSPFNCLITYAWSRAASLVYAGERDGLGYRDTVQDMLGVMHNIPDEAVKRLELMITGQVSTGGAMPVVKPFAHNPGKEKAPEKSEYRSDDCMWLFNSIPAYVKESGDIDFYKKVLPYADKGKDTVLGHLKRAIEFNLERSGQHGLPCGLLADWNDCLKLGYGGETVFVAFQLRYALIVFIDICKKINELKDIAWAEKNLEQLDKNLDQYAWDGDWYLRAYREDGLKFGSKENDEGSIFMNANTWAVISGHAKGEKAKKAMQSVYDQLATEYGVMLCAPPFIHTDFNVVRATLMNPGMKENCAIFNHTQGWGVMAEAMMGNGNRAYNYFKSFLPASFNDKAEIRQTEPYVYSQSTLSKFHPDFGASRLPWLSGTASWAYYSFTQYILGIRPDYDGLIVYPCLPQNWKGFKAVRRFRNILYTIEVINETGDGKGVKKLLIGGKEQTGHLIPVQKQDVDVKVFL